MAKGTLPWQPIFKVIAKSGFILSPDIPKGIVISQFWFFKNFICDDLATLFVKLVNFGPVTPEFNIAKDVHPVVSFFKININRSDFHHIFITLVDIWL